MGSDTEVGLLQMRATTDYHRLLHWEAFAKSRHVGTRKSELEDVSGYPLGVL